MEGDDADDVVEDDDTIKYCNAVYHENYVREV